MRGEQETTMTDMGAAAVLAGGWRARVAALGVVPDTDSMLAYAAGRGWRPSLDYGLVMRQTDLHDVVWLWTAEVLSTRHGDTPAEALGAALLAAVGDDGG